ncbi:rhombosortase [Microbulbifer litoralis]|uniref:rhombosortase n=1 Tax=Microbulbifer litoralis TaxID=2933965 RepID=UPI0020283723|nr:rhombosortase [Microbulbifer sp. GX H0434]
MSNLNFPPRGAGGPLLLILACALLQLCHLAWLEFDREALATGQLWRLLSGHLVHTNGTHLVMNVGAVAMLWLLHGQHYRAPVYLGLVVALSLLISPGLWYWFPGLELYRGLSGVLHGLFCWGCCRDLAGRRLSGALLLAGCYGKVAWELIVGPNAATAELIRAEVAVSSHLLGALAGTAIGLAGVWRVWVDWGKPLYGGRKSRIPLRSIRATPVDPQSRTSKLE